MLFSVSICIRSCCFSKHSRLNLSRPILYPDVMNYTAWLRTHEQVSLWVMPSALPVPPGPEADRLRRRGMRSYSGSVASRWMGFFSITSPNTYVNAYLTFFYDSFRAPPGALPFYNKRKCKAEISATISAKHRGASSKSLLFLFCVASMAAFTWAL